MPIHEQFEMIEDRQFAEAASELFLRMPDMKLAHELKAEEEFPPEPSYLAGLQLAYREIDDEGERVRRQMLFIDQRPAVLDGFATTYDEALGATHPAMQAALLGASAEASGKFLEIPLQLSQAAGLRTVAGFALFQSMDRSRFYPALYLPRRTLEEAPFSFRAIFVSIMNERGKDQMITDDPMAGLTREDLEQVLRAEGAMKNAGIMLASMHLPEASVVAGIISHMRGAQNPAQPSRGPNRAQRRAAKGPNRRRGIY